MIIQKFSKSQKLLSKLTKYPGHFFPHKRPPQNVWSSKKILSPRNCYQKPTKYSGHYFPHQRPPQNVWSSKKFLSPRNCYQKPIKYSVRALLSSQKTATKCVIIQYFFKSQKLLSKTNKVFRALLSTQKNLYKMCDHSSRANWLEQE